MTTEIERREPRGEMVAHVAAEAREQAEIQGLLALAQRFPRDELTAAAKIQASCRIPEFAKTAVYSFRRGGNAIEGPSVALAREMARCWGRVKYGFRVLENDGLWITVEGYAVDLETLAMTTVQDRFRALIQRRDKRTGETRWIQPDERDAREMIFRRGAIVQRNAILACLPEHLKREAVRESKATTIAAAKGELKQDREGTIRSIVAAFAQQGISRERLEARLGHDVTEVEAEEIDELRGNLRAILEGSAKPSELFPVPRGSERGETGQEAPQAGPGALDAELAKQPGAGKAEARSEAPAKPGKGSKP